VPSATRVVTSKTGNGPAQKEVDRDGGRGGVAEIQRARIMAAMTELVREQGVAGVTVAHVVGRSGVSRRTFYELFDDREDCLAAAFEYAVGRAAAVVLPAYEGDRGGGAWEQRIRAGLGALLEFFDEQPGMGGLCVVDSLAAERDVLARRARVVGVLIDAVHSGGARPRGRAGATAPVAGMGEGGAVGVAVRPARIVAEGAVGAVLAVIHARLCERDPKPLAGLLNQLMGMIVLPYRGPEAAQRELLRPARRGRRRPAAPADPLRDLRMRLTYRTVRVLLAIAELGGRGAEGGRGSNNREVADAAGVSDQGQISKLLWRLEHLGLIDTAVHHHGRGEPNAWSLTAKGQAVARAIRSQAGG
jgi:AcrR family transcriptional regulator